jgi:hypothetical protein
MAGVTIEERRASVYWEPKEDITVYELALALGVLLPAAGGSFRAPQELVSCLPAAAQRHFRVAD